MTIGFQRSDDKLQCQCPNCGRFPSEDDGFYAWVESEPDGISLFCNEECALRFETKGGQLVDGDGEPYSLQSLAS
jgi:hypothetical protein